MAKAKVVAAAPSTVNCSICGEAIGLNDYAKHIQERHSSAPAPTPPATSAIPRANIPNGPMPFPGGPPQQSIGGGPGPMGGGPRPMTGPIRGEDYAGVPYLKGSDLPVGVNEVRVKVLQFMYIPGQRSPLACQIEKVHGKEIMGINKTNIKQLMTLGFPDLSLVIGRTLVLGTYPVNNPTTGAMTKGLWITSVE